MKQKNAKGTRSSKAVNTAFGITAKDMTERGGEHLNKKALCDKEAF